MRRIDRLRRVLGSRPFFASLGALILGVWLNTLAGTRASRLASLPQVPDWLLERLPLVTWPWAYDVLVLLIFGIFAFYLWREEIESIPHVLLLFGLINAIRALFIFLGPLANPASSYPGLFEQLLGPAVGGMYPSGHTASGVLALLLARGAWRIPLAACVLLMVGFLLLARGHYTIDVLSAALFAYAVYMFGESKLRKPAGVTRSAAAGTAVLVLRPARRR